MSVATATERYEQHLAILMRRLEGALEDGNFDALLVLAGAPRPAFRDDNPYPFRPNPYFMQWVPLVAEPGASLLLRPGRRPTLCLVRELDIWHSPAEDVPGDLAAALEIQHCAAPALPGPAELAGVRSLAIVGEGPPPVLPCECALNPPALLARLDFERAYKTPHELHRLRAATGRAVRAHAAAAAAFAEGLSEYAIRQRYLGAIEALEADMPYGPIIALNEHAATLHYDGCDRAAPARHLSFLIDAGASVGGYHADITRSYASAGEPWEELCARMDGLQQALVASLRLGELFPVLQGRMHAALADLLCETGVLRCSPEAAVERGLTRLFCPHGLGHFLGAQVHDVGGKLASPEGDELPGSPEHPYLRLLRPVEEGNVFTIEPGLYFIDGLLSPEAGSRDIDWSLVERLRPCGGIRVEDNIAVVDGGIHNLTREAFAELSP